MVTYIDREAALSIHEPPKLNRHYQTDNLDDVYSQGWDDALCSIKHISAANVVPVVYGKWGMGRFNLETGDYEEQCIRCRDFSKEYGKPYCPNCGAKMDGGDSNASD